MLNQISTAMHDVANKSAQQTIARAVSIRDKTRRLISTARHALTMLGLVAIATLTLMFFKPEIADRIQELSPFSPAVAATASPQLAGELIGEADADEVDDAQPIQTSDATDNLGTDIQQRRVTQWLSKRYRVADDATNMLVSAAYLTGKEIHFDPLLILAVMAIESRFNPFAESPVGAQGLMQVMSKVHYDKFEEMGGTRSALNPVVNIKVGAMILKEYIQRGGSIEAGLKRYVGAANMASDDGYGAKVLGEYDRLKAVANGKRISVFAKMTSRAAPRVQPIPNAVEQKATTLNEKTAMDDHAKKIDGDMQSTSL